MNGTGIVNIVLLLGKRRKKTAKDRENPSPVLHFCCGRKWHIKGAGGVGRGDYSSAAVIDLVISQTNNLLSDLQVW